MAEEEKALDAITRPLLKYIEKTPKLLSFLYDLDLMPEQLDRKSRNWFRMLQIAEEWKQRGTI